MNILTRRISAFAILLFFSSQGATAQEIPPSSASAELGQRIPQHVAAMAACLAAGKWSESQDFDEDDGKARAARINADEWIDRVFSEGWAPGEGSRSLLIENALSNRDIAYRAWNSGEGRIEVAQTKSIFYARLEFENQKMDTRQVARLMSRVLKEQGERWSAEGKALPLPNLNEKIVEISVLKGETKRVAKQRLLFGRPANPASFNERQQTDRAAKQDSATGDNWFESPSADLYWFRHIQWWTDGETLNIYFLKSNGGSWAPSYHSPLDLEWFGT